ncbi:MAG TPA: transglutaminase-like domain-containing protein [Phycisphaerae bacterium]|nr:transglutaminase-like domain-containing protein [Phycisphaerae bacterium]
MIQQTFPHRRGAAIALLILLAAAPCPSASAAADAEHTFTLSAHDAFENGMGAWAVRYDGNGVVLYDRNLIEDDGPGISSNVRWLKTHRAPTQEVSGTARIKKVLHVARPEAIEARLYVERGVSVQINGTEVDIAGNTRYPPIPVSLLKKGDNEIVVYCRDDSRRTIKIARPEDILRNAPDRKGRPRRSFFSKDSGKTWQPIDGEYMVRLHLVQYAGQGHFISPAIDLGSPPSGPPVLLSGATVLSAALKPDADTPAGTRIDLAVRTGPCPVYDKRLWSDWNPPGAAAPAGHRYLQWKATLSSANPLRTPVLRSVAVEAKVSVSPPPGWAGGVKVVKSHNEQIRYTSIPFEYEDPLHARMVALRRKYKLDEVVAGSKSELEEMVKLRDWVAHQWRFTAPASNYPAWDADEILTRKIGMCVQYAIVFMQCSISLGRQARFAFGNHPGAIDGGGHEVCEWWSNEHGKWVFFDVNQSWHHIDARTKAPLNLLDIHDMIIKEYYGGGFADWAKRPRKAEYTDAVQCCYGTSLVPNEPSSRRAKTWHIKDGLYRVPSRWLYIRYMPRNNFLSRPDPVPVAQGSHWDYSDYVVHEDAFTPTQWLYRNFTGRRSDVAWTINQVHYEARYGREPRTLRIQMGTSTPYLKTYLVNVDGKGWKESSSAFDWQLHPGRNRLEMRVRNTSGVEGPVSLIELDSAQ